MLTGLTSLVTKSWTRKLLRDIFFFVSILCLDGWDDRTAGAVEEEESVWSYQCIVGNCVAFQTNLVCAPTRLILLLRLLISNSALLSLQLVQNSQIRRGVEQLYWLSWAPSGLASPDSICSLQHWGALLAESGQRSNDNRDSNRSVASSNRNSSRSNDNVSASVSTRQQWRQRWQPQPRPQQQRVPWRIMRLKPVAMNATDYNTLQRWSRGRT
jgi:hypothetical protein